MPYNWFFNLQHTKIDFQQPKLGVIFIFKTTYSEGVTNKGFNPYHKRHFFSASHTVLKSSNHVRKMKATRVSCSKLGQSYPLVDKYYQNLLSYPVVSAIHPSNNWGQEFLRALTYSLKLFEIQTNLINKLCFFANLQTFVNFSKFKALGEFLISFLEIVTYYRRVGQVV